MYVIGGAQTYSKQPDRYPAGAPRFAHRAKGAYIYPTVGSERWIDCTSALGAVILGYGNAAVEEAVIRQVRDGIAFSLPTELEQAFADALTPIVPSGLDSIRYGKNGADVTGAAVRLARAYTSRAYIAMSISGYHGHHDWSMTRPPSNAGVPAAMLDHTVFYEHGNLQSVEAALSANEVAAVVVEPVESGRPGVLDRTSFLQGVSRLCVKFGALLVVDEVVTGIRGPSFGFCAHWGVTPDLLCLGKGIANGFPLSVLIGSGDVMERIERDVFFSTTHGGDAVSLAAGIATIREARRRYLPTVVAEAGQRIRNAFDTTADSRGLEARTVGYDARVVFSFRDNGARAKFLDALTARRILCQGYVNMTLSLAEPGPLDQLVDAIVDSVGEVRP